MNYLRPRRPTKGRIFILHCNIITCFGKAPGVWTANGGGPSANSWHSSDRALWVHKTLSCPRRVAP